MWESSSDDVAVTVDLAMLVEQVWKQRTHRSSMSPIYMTKRLSSSFDVVKTARNHHFEIHPLERLVHPLLRPAPSLGMGRGSPPGSAAV